MHAMRRKDREITDRNALQAIMREAQVCRLGLSDDSMPYVVPMNFGLGENCLYLHCAKEGRKIDILRKNSRVCFEMDLLLEIRKASGPCGWGARYESVIGFGQAVFVDDPAEKRAALDRIMEHYHATGPFPYPGETLNRTAIIRIDIESFTGKRRD